MDKEHTKALDIKSWLRCLEGYSHQEAELNLRKQHYLEDKNLLRSLVHLLAQSRRNEMMVLKAVSSQLLNTSKDSNLTSFLSLCYSV